MNINKINIYVSFTSFTITKLNINIRRKWRKCVKNACNVLIYFHLMPFLGENRIYVIGFFITLYITLIDTFIYGIYGIYAPTYIQISGLKKQTP